MTVSSLYYTLMCVEMQCRYGEIRAIWCWDSEIPLRSESLRPIGELNAPRVVVGLFMVNSKNR